MSSSSSPLDLVHHLHWTPILLQAGLASASSSSSFPSSRREPRLRRRGNRASGTRPGPGRPPPNTTHGEREGRKEGRKEGKKEGRKEGGPLPAPKMAAAALPVAGAASGGKMAAEEEGGPSGSGRLSELLESGWRLLEEAEAEGGGVEAQRKVQRGIALLERTARAVAELQLFSGNEELEELPSADLRFLPVPALLGALVLKQESPSRRLEHLRRARALFLRFLRLCRDYGLLPHGQMPPEKEEDDDNEEEEEPQEEPSGSSARRPPAAASDQDAFLAMAASRRAKIERYKHKKELESRLAALRPLVEAGRAEEEHLREYYLLQIKKWIGTSLEEVESLDRERAILARRDALKQGSAMESPTHPPRHPMKPFILTRDAAQAKVFGAGYPSLATMTVDDWYEQHQKHGGLPDMGISQRSSGITEEQQEEAEGRKAAEEEEEEEAAVQKARQWDEWKDSHQRGYGNRKNMG